MPHHRTDRLLLFGFVVVNLVLKLSWLGVNELAHDEPFTVFWSQRPWAELWAMFRTENNPPLYFLLIKVWSAVVPFETAWLRVPSAVFSGLAVWPLVLLARHFGGRGAALLAGLVFTCSNYHYGFAHEVRAYPLFTLLTTTGLWLLVRATQRPGQEMKGLLHLSMLNVVLVYTHFFGWLVVGLQGLLVFAIPAMRPLRQGFLFGAAMTAVWFLPYGIIFLERMSQSVGQGTWLAPPVPEELYNMVWRWSNAPVLTVVFLALIVAAIGKDRLRSDGMRFALIWAFVPLLGMFAVSFAVPMFLDRYLVYAAPGFALLVGLSVVVLVRNERLRAGVIGALGLGLVATFTPWKDTGLHPSRVVQVEREWCGDDCSVQVLPRWYWLTHFAAKDINSLRRPTDQHLAYFTGTGRRTDAKVPSAPLDTLPVALVIDAGAHLVDPERGWYRDLRTIYPHVDSVEADRKVWVYRFRR
jgi:mannosyltransferase